MERFKRQPLSSEHQDMLTNAIKRTEEKLCIYTMLDCGLRVAELAKLSRFDILTQERHLRFKGKGGKIRTVPVPTRTWVILQSWFAIQDSIPLGVRGIQKMVKRIANRAIVPAIVTPHVLRHSYACNLLKKGAKITTIRDMLGHNNLQTTMIYLNMLPIDSIREAERLAI